MDRLNASGTPGWPFWLYTLLVFALLTLIISLSYFLGQRHRTAASDQPYESGILETGSARLRFSAQFYLIAMMFGIYRAVGSGFP
jgi:NADH-quinone oxidoreductase subunit A